MRTLYRLLYLSALCSWPFFSASAQVEDILINKAVETAVDEIPSIFLDEEQLKEGGGPTDTTFDWDEIWRSSDLEGERGTQRNSGPDDWEVRPKGKRIGCICMDGTEQKHRGRGACGGRGGVRYWIYETPEGKEMTHPTRRHFSHPDPMTSDEKLGLAAYNEEQEPPGKKRLGNSLDSFVSLAIVMGSLTMVVYYMRAILLQQPRRRRSRKRRKRQDGDQNTTES
jgi:hypothetical protein